MTHPLRRQNRSDLRKWIFLSILTACMLFSFPTRAGKRKASEYIVKPGDSVARVADFHGVGQDDLRRANGLKPDEPIRPGQTLVIPDALRGGAAKGHVVKAGDTFAAIAKKHGVSIQALATANKLTPTSQLDIGRTLIIPEPEDDAVPAHRPKKVRNLVKTGEKVPGGVRHTVQPGQSLWVIARAYNTTGQRIAKANGFTPTDSLRVDQEILIPGAKAVVPVRTKGFAIQSVRFVSVWNDKSATLKLLSRRGRVNPRSRRVLSKLAGPKTKKKRRLQLLHPRLIHMLQRVAERFPGHTIEIVSGYRPHKRGTRRSKHSQGRAVDFRVRGVSNRELYDFIKDFPNTGTGYYPNSVFVHLDVRRKTTHWTDVSGKGEKPHYLKDGQPAPEEDVEAAADALSEGE
ncbi:MAG: LysM peptidoglycan-binding domain-containing protein [Myxococcota bacterium]|nr:LysM peptidoglycan-binding domain-containing protein [Myxococcota bacterium]